LCVDVHDGARVNGFSGRLDYTRTYGCHGTVLVVIDAFIEPFPVALSRNGASVRTTTTTVSNEIQVHSEDSVSMAEMDPLGFEPRASSLQRRHSPAELWARVSFGSSKAPVWRLYLFCLFCQNTRTETEVPSLGQCCVTCRDVSSRL
jgi:hypothetical protein